MTDLEQKLQELFDALQEFKETDPAGYAASEEVLLRNIEAMLATLQNEASE